MEGLHRRSWWLGLTEGLDKGLQYGLDRWKVSKVSTEGLDNLQIRLGLTATAGINGLEARIKGDGVDRRLRGKD